MQGLVVEGRYAYGGIVSNGCSGDGDECTYRGEVVKMDLDERKVVDRWYSLPEITSEDDGYYYGAAPENYPAIIGDYVVVGTGPLFANPNEVDACLSNDNVSLGDGFNPCDEDMSSYAAWRCLEDDVYASAINVLDKNTLVHLDS